MLYMLSREGQLAVISLVVVSLYPLILVVLGSLVRRETVSATAAVGIGLSALATILVMVGNGEW